MLKDISKRVKYYRKKKGLNQEHMADKLGVNQNSYARIENNITRLDLERFFKIAQILEVDKYFLLTGEVPNFHLINSEAYDTYIENLKCIIKMQEEEIIILKRKLGY